MEIKNRKAERNYQILQTIEAGIVLTGNEIKSIRAGRVNFLDSYAKIQNGEVWLYNLHISLYNKGSFQEEKPDRKRKLLLKKREIERWSRQLEQRGFTLVPLKLYINENGLAKLELGLAKGRKKYEKREKIKERDMKREELQIHRGKI
jgi:SsrA-binding protein